jgi:hypothetical protein
MALGEPCCPHCGGGLTGGPSPFMPQSVTRPPARCPICYGRGTLPHDFYNQLGSGISTERVECQACHGKGIV